MIKSLPQELIRELELELKREAMVEEKLQEAYYLWYAEKEETCPSPSAA
ncbi:MAG: hypothetical protein HPY89_09435 [Pelotomaculum sp.]|uniref:Uncharacterized protein n=1 Tax=Pelotomaculum thermopropionicum (strain DSM 13744 / JCM 10971 / SI) TaxID=370438 RepID=A5D4R1_PELTS|nr:hypothetical protein [Pelotomaculum sp.]BAF58770.1 hypothetical protein PTH_0589 [Pelotomaculum thermopropionicum SI]